uniref:Uncharacterized protein n=1 Tax=Hucho hucho TaxID=62062 RepID=A0A4W5NEG7_9TELE
MGRNMKNVLIVSCGLLLMFTANGSLQSLQQDSMHSTKSNKTKSIKATVFPHLTSYRQQTTDNMESGNTISLLTVNVTQGETQLCGVSSTGSSTEISTVYSAGVNLLAVILVAAFLDDIDSKNKLGNKEPLCGFPYCGLHQCTHLFCSGKTLYLTTLCTFLKNYATCALGIHFVGYVMICFGSTTSLYSILFGKLSQYIGREALFHLVRGDTLTVFFVFPAFWGNADAVWQTQIKAFANYRLWESVGFVMFYALSNFISGNQALHPGWCSTCGSCTLWWGGIQTEKKFYTEGGIKSKP